MKRNIIPQAIWSQLSDHEKIADVVRAAVQNEPKDRPTYGYLVEFLSDVHNAYQDETELRKWLAQTNIVLMTFIVIIFIVAMVGWIR